MSTPGLRYAPAQVIAASFWKVIGSMTSVASAVIAAILIGSLYFGREVFIPVALAILLSFVLAPMVRLLQG